MAKACTVLMLSNTNRNQHAHVGVYRSQASRGPHILPVPCPTCSSALSLSQGKTESNLR